MQSKLIVSIRGHFKYNQEYKNAHNSRHPPQLVHPEVFKLTLAQLRVGADTTKEQETNLCMARTRAYSTPDSLLWVISRKTHTDGSSELDSCFIYSTGSLTVHRVFALQLLHGPRVKSG